MLTYRSIGVIGSREFKNYEQLSKCLDSYNKGNEPIHLVSGGAIGADSMAQRYAKERGLSITIHYPDYERWGKPATFIRNRRIIEESDLVLAFYAKGRYQQGGTANSASWARKLGKELIEFEEE